MFTVSEALDLLDQLKVSSEDLDKAKMYIQLPVNPNNEYKSDIDAGDETESTGDATCLSGNQLLSTAVVDNGLSKR